MSSAAYLIFTTASYVELRWEGGGGVMMVLRTPSGVQFVLASSPSQRR